MSNMVAGKPLLSEDLEDHISAAKACLLSSNGGASTVYDHLVVIMRQVIEDKPSIIDNIVNEYNPEQKKSSSIPDNLLKEYSRDSKKSTFIPDPDTIQEKQKASKECAIALQQKSLFKRKDAKEALSNTIVRDDDDEEEESQLGLSVPNVMENAYYFELAGNGIGREECFRTFLALKQLSDNLKLKSCRFWGKMFCIHKDYIIAEVEFYENEDPHWKDDDDVIADDVEGSSPIRSSVEDELQKVDDDDDDGIPQSTFKPPSVVPKEQYGEGCNSKVYYVTNNAGLPWTRLPTVTPAQIQCARKIRKFLTGDLESDIISYPPFPGKEANFLRAQIARITHATHVSPQGFYIFEEEEDEEDDDTRTAIIPDVEYEPIPVSDLCDPSFTFWVHHNLFILPQGRTSWVDPNAAPMGEGDDGSGVESEDDEREEPEDEEPEEGPPLLAPLSEDEPVNGKPAWTAVKSTNHFSQYAIAVLHSNVWPGAHTFAYEKKFENIYIGYGLKYEADNFNPQMPPALQEEYPSGPDITEAEDPTVEQERAVLAARKEAEDEEEEADESEDYDDDNEE